MPQSAIMVTPTCRYISGDISVKRTTDFENRPIPPEKQQFEFGVAIMKNDPGVGPLLQAIQAHAFQEFANNPAAQVPISNFDLKGFSWKIADGDAPNREGKVSENSAGCWVFYFKSSFAIKCSDQNGAEIPPTDIKRGWYVWIAFQVSGNGETGDRAGIYLNPQNVQLLAYGKEITGGLTAEQAFAGHAVPTALPPGASPTPLATGPMPGLPAPATAPVAAPAMPPALPGATAPVAQPGVSQDAPPSSPQPSLPSTTVSHGNVAPLPNFANGPGAPR